MSGLPQETEGHDIAVFITGVPLGLIKPLKKVNVRLPGQGNSNSHGARPVHKIILMIEWVVNKEISLSRKPSWQETEGHDITVFITGVPPGLITGSHVLSERFLY